MPRSFSFIFHGKPRVSHMYVYPNIYISIHIIGVRKIEQEKRFAGCYTMDHFAISSPMASMASNIGKYQDPGHTEASLR